MVVQSTHKSLPTIVISVSNTRLQKLKLGSADGINPNYLLQIGKRVQ